MKLFITRCIIHVHQFGNAHNTKALIKQNCVSYVRAFTKSLIHHKKISLRFQKER